MITFEWKNPYDELGVMHVTDMQCRLMPDCELQNTAYLMNKQAYKTLGNQNEFRGAKVRNRFIKSESENVTSEFLELVISQVK